MSAKDKGLQDRQADELNTPVENGLEADSDIISSRDRDVFLKQYQEHERSELRDQGFDDDEIRAILGEDTEDETEKAGEAGSHCRISFNWARKMTRTWSSSTTFF